MKRLLQSFCLPLCIPLCFLVLWQCLALRMDNEIILPRVDQVLDLLAHPFADVISMGSLLANIGISLARVLTGYCVAALLAVPLGIAIGYSGRTDRLLTGFLGLFRSIPPLAWVPLVLAWFGVSSLANVFSVPLGPLYVQLHNIKLSMLFIIFIGGFYPILTSSIHGVRMVTTTLLDAAKVLGASNATVFFKVLLPGSAPSIVNGLRIGLGVSWMCLVSAEMLPGSLSGVGYLITHAYTVGRTDVVVAGMVSIGLIGAGLDWLFRLAEERKFTWKQLTR
ncbi:ABC transporter permease [Desulfovibrio sp. OttesenSCG-928-G15]|nr:ABC transporter permease [Desulfovibrio sp. OttesenSCG-928-G15]